jgi:hypothetical protein
MHTRKLAVVFITAAALLPSIAQAMEPITVFKSASCGCCVGWMKHLEANGFQATGKNLPSGALMQKNVRWALSLNSRPATPARLQDTWWKAMFPPVRFGAYSRRGRTPSG